MIELSLTDWLSLLLFATAVTFSPGPNTLISSTLGVNMGWRACVPFVGGVAVGVAVIFWLLTAGMQWMIARFTWITPVVQIIGLAYVAYLLYVLWCEAPLGLKSQERDFPVYGLAYFCNL